MAEIQELRDANITLWQSNFITSSRYEMSALEKNIMYMVMSQLKKNDPSDMKYIVSAMELMQSTGKDILYADLKKASAKLITRILEGVNEDGNLVQTSFIASATYITGKGLIEIEISNAIRPHYIELKEKFTTFQLDIALSLKSIYSKRLYEILSMYKNFKEKKFTISVKELKMKLALISSKGEDKYEAFRNFKIAVLDPAEREINGDSDIYFTYKALEGKKYGKGRKPIDLLEFNVMYKERKDVEIGYDEANKPIYDRLINDFGLRKDQASEVIRNYSKIEINKQLYDIHIAKMNNKVGNIGAYTATIFKVK